MEEIRICLWCGNEFTYIRKTKTCCSNRCISSLNQAVKKKGMTKEEIYEWRKSHGFQKYFHEKGERRERERARKRKQQKDKGIDPDIELFFKRLKAQKWRLKQSDAERIVMMYSDIFVGAQEKLNDNFLLKCLIKLKQKYNFDI